MPYISEDKRVQYADGLDSLLKSLKTCSDEELGGHLNYCLSKLALELFRDKRCYDRINTINGVFLSAQQEFARRSVGPYEDHKIIANGDL